MTTIAYRRGSERLTGAASLKHRIPAVGVGSYLDNAQRLSNTLIRCGCGFESRYPLTGQKPLSQ